MTDTVKKLIMFDYHSHSQIEKMLTDYAAEGLILEKISAFLWTFKKAESQNLKYTITFFSEGSIFNPDPTANQLTYFDYAKQAGWDFVCECNKIQIFSSSVENPIPFETDEAEKLDNIHKNMKKTNIPSHLVLLLVFGLNFALRISTFWQNPLDFLQQNTNFATMLMFAAIVAYTLFSLIAYFRWHKRAKQAVALGNNCPDLYGKSKKYLDLAYIIIIFLLALLMFSQLASGSSFSLILLGLAQVPLVGLVFWGCLKLLKKLKVAARVNKIISYSLLALFSFLYINLIFFVITNFDLSGDSDKPYTTVEWAFVSGEIQEYRLYQDDIPLKCEDLYDTAGFEHYSYEENEQNSIFLQTIEYSQNAPPTYGEPPELVYTLYAPNFDFVNDLVIRDFINIDDWMEKEIELLDNGLFDTIEAYSFYYPDGQMKNYNGEYVLVFADKIIHLNAEQLLTDEQVEVVKEKLLKQM